MAEISDAMKLNCSKARSETVRIVADLPPDDTESLPNEENNNDKRQARILKLKLGMKKRTTLYKADDMKIFIPRRKIGRKGLLQRKLKFQKRK